MGNHRSRLLAVVLLATLAACSRGAGDQTDASALTDDAITVGSFDFMESKLLGEIYAQTLEAGGYTVVRAFDLGPREFVTPALASGLVEFVPDYAGTATQFLSSGTPGGGTTRGTREALLDALRDGPIRALASAPAENANTFVVTKQTADRYDLRKLSDVAAVGPSLLLGGPPECPTRPLCELGLERTYGVTFKDFVTLDAGGAVTRQALKEGSVDIALLFTTDPSIETAGLVELVDDRGLQPAENVTPLVRAEVLERWGPGVQRVIDATSASLTTEELRALNGQMLADGATVRDVASQWLKEHATK